MPELAAAPPAVSAGGRVYTFRIRAGYRFSPPSGQPVTAAAFERAIERMLHPRTVFGRGARRRRRRRGVPRRARRTVAGVSARGDRLTIRLTRPSPTLPARMATFYFCAVPPNTPIRPRGLERVAAAGPYYVAAVRAAQAPGAAPQPRLSRSRGRSACEEIEVTIGTTPARAVADVEAGRADYIAQRAAPDAQARLIARYGPGSRAAASGRQRYFAGPAPARPGLVFNPRRPLFARAAMRRAVNYAIDRRALARRPRPPVLAGRPTDQHIPPGFPGFRDATIYPLGGPDLADGPAPGGRRPAARRPLHVQPAECIEQAEIVRANLAAIGIELEIRRFSFSELFAAAGEPRRAVRPVALRLGRRHPGPVGVHRRPCSNAHADGPVFLERTRLGQRMRAARRLEGGRAARRPTPRWTATSRPRRRRSPRTSAARATDFFSARIGCQVEHPLYGIDLAALCVRR